jgi:phosphopantetheinyl transferase (holo-ACP synthase)
VGWVHGLGIDACEAAEFAAPYPLERAFRASELAWASEVCRGDSAEAAALLWAAKEACVKALGWGFHLCHPLDVGIVPCGGGGLDLHLRALGWETLEVRARRHLRDWVALAVWDPRAAPPRR